MLQDISLRAFIAVQTLLQAERSERGQTLAEYSLIISTVAVAVTILSVIVFREALVEAWNSAIPCLTGSC